MTVLALSAIKHSLVGCIELIENGQLVCNIRDLRYSVAVQAARAKVIVMADNIQCSAQDLSVEWHPQELKLLVLLRNSSSKLFVIDVLQSQCHCIDTDGILGNSQSNSNFICCVRWLAGAFGLAGVCTSIVLVRPSNSLYELVVLQYESNILDLSITSRVSLDVASNSSHKWFIRFSQNSSILALAVSSYTNLSEKSSTAAAFSEVNANGEDASVAITCFEVVGNCMLRGRLSVGDRREVHLANAVDDVFISGNSLHLLLRSSSLSFTQIFKWDYLANVCSRLDQSAQLEEGQILTMAVDDVDQMGVLAILKDSCSVDLYGISEAAVVLHSSTYLVSPVVVSGGSISTELMQVSDQVGFLAVNNRFVVHAAQSGSCSSQHLLRTEVSNSESREDQLKMLLDHVIDVKSVRDLCSLLPMLKQCASSDLKEQVKSLMVNCIEELRLAGDHDMLSLMQSVLNEAAPFVQYHHGGNDARMHSTADDSFSCDRITAMPITDHFEEYASIEAESRAFAIKSEQCPGCMGRFDGRQCGNDVFGVFFWWQEYWRHCCLCGAIRYQ